MNRYRSPGALAAIEQYCRLAGTSGVTMAQLSLGWCRSRWYCTSTIVGATSVEQLQDEDFHTVRELNVRGRVQKIAGLSETKPKSMMTIKQFNSQINIRAEAVNNGWRKVSEGDVVEVLGLALANAPDKRFGVHDLKFYEKSTIVKTTSGNDEDGS